MDVKSVEGESPTREQTRESGALTCGQTHRSRAGQAPMSS